MHKSITTSHIGFLQYPHLAKICQPLFTKTPVSYFCYHRLYLNNSYTLLPTQPDLGEFYFQDQTYRNVWIFNIPFKKLASGVLYWELAKKFNTQEQEEVTQSIDYDLGLSCGIDILDKYENCCDFYSFASNSLEIYQCDLNFLKRFIYYFKQEAKHYIQQAFGEKFSLNLEAERNKPIPIIDTHTPSDEIFDIKKYYLELERKEVYFTAQELNCLNELSKGCTAKEAAFI
ncbi:MAG: hypothetical protein ACK4PR_06250, partial [Gammaproteobacteria bacterium]